MVDETCFVPPLSKDEADFESSPPAGESDCDDCVHWIDQNGGLCHYVQGSIPGEAWCVHWADKGEFTREGETVDIQTPEGIEFKRETMLRP